MSDVVLARGTEVKTPYGWGFVAVDATDAARILVKLDEWDRSILPTLFTSIEYIQQASFCSIGNCIYTKYGMGILLDYRRPSGIHVVRLWLPNGAQGASIAYMNKSDILKVIPAMSGMQISTKSNVQGIIYKYSNDLDSFEIVTSNGTHTSIRSDDIIVPKTTIQSTTTSHYLVNHIGQNLKPYKKSIVSFVSLISTMQKGDNIDISSDELLKTFVGNDINLDEQKQKIIQIIHDIKNRITQLVNANTTESESISSTIVSLSAPMVAPLLSKLDGIINSLESNISLANNSSSFISMTSDIAVLLYSSGSMYMDGNENNVLSTVYKLALNDPLLQQILDGLRSASSIWTSRLNEIKKMVDTFSTVLYSTKSMSILTNGSEALRTRLASLVDYKAVTNTVDSNNLALKEIPDILGNKLKAENTLVSLKNRLITASNDQDYTNKVQGMLMNILSTYGVYNPNMDSNSIQIMIFALLNSFQDSSKHFLSTSWCDNAEIQLTQIFDKMATTTASNSGIAIEELSVYSGYEIRRKFQRPETSLQSLDVTTISSMVPSTMIPTNIIDPLQSWAQQVGIDTKQLMSFNGAINMAKNALESDALENVAKKIVKAGDTLITSIESIRDNSVVQSALSQLSNGDFSNSLVSSVKDLQLNNVLAMAETVITDAEARDTLIERVKDQILEFFLQYIPTLSLPDLDGIKDDIEYSVLGLNLSGFKLKKEGVTLELGQSSMVKLGHDVLSFTATGINAKFRGLHWRYAQTYFPHLRGDGNADAEVENVSIKIGFKIIRVPKGTTTTLNMSLTEGTTSLYKKYPTLAESVANYRYSRQINQGNVDGYSDDFDIWPDVEEWEPALVLSDCTIEIENLSLEIDNSSFSWLYNALISVFSSVIKEYVRSSIRDIIHSSSAYLLSIINGAVGEYWSLIKQILSIPLDDLPVANAADIAALVGPNADNTSDWDYILKFDEEGALGLKVDIKRSDDITQRNMGESIVISKVFPKGQAINALKIAGVTAEQSIGSTIRSVNGRLMTGQTPDIILQTLKGPRPLAIGLRLSKSGHELRKRMRERGLAVDTKPSRRALRAYMVEFGDGSLGLKLKDTKSCGGAIIITAFTRGPNDELLQAEAAGVLNVGMIMLSINNQICFGQPCDEVMNRLKSTPRPLQIVFVPSPDEQVILAGYPAGLRLSTIEGHIMVSSFNSTKNGPSAGNSNSGSSNPVSSNGEVIYSVDRLKKILKPGSVLLRINKTTVTPTMTPEEAIALINSEMPSRIAVRDMDSFMHLIRIRDKEETLDDCLF